MIHQIGEFLPKANLFIFGRLRASGNRLVVIELNIRIVDNKKPSIPELKAKINVIEGHGKLLGEPSNRIEIRSRNHQA